MGSDVTRSSRALIGDELRHRLQQIRHLALDLDGTLYLGRTLFESTPGFLRSLKRMGIGYTFFTNNSSRSARQYVSHLIDMGIEANTDMVYSSTHSTIEYLREAHPDARRVFAMGTPGFEQELIEAGLTISPTHPEVVVVGFDTGLTYSRLARAAYWIKEGKPFIATHPDLVCPTDQPQILPDCGAICQLLTAATGRQPDAVLGKPNVAMLNGMLRRHRLSRCEVAMVGDRLYTDMAMAHNAGVLGVLVLTGETRREQAEKAKPAPDLVIEDAGELAGLLMNARETVDTL